MEGWSVRQIYLSKSKTHPTKAYSFVQVVWSLNAGTFRININVFRLYKFVCLYVQNVSFMKYIGTSHPFPDHSGPFRPTGYPNYWYWCLVAWFLYGIMESSNAIHQNRHILLATLLERPQSVSLLHYKAFKLHSIEVSNG